jgi:hypothetical protein
MENLSITEITVEDYNNGYMNLMHEFSNYKKDVTKQNFKEYISNRDKVRIVVVRDIENKTSVPTEKQQNVIQRVMGVQLKIKNFKP